jgi:RHS repeat-associated protein
MLTLERITSFGELKMRTAIFQKVSETTVSLRQSTTRAFTWRNVRLFAAALVLALATSGAAHAQSGAGTTNYLDAVGQPEFSTPTPVELGYVEQANGHLHLEIPVGQAIPQRGNPKGFQFRITYDSNFWTQVLDPADIPLWTASTPGNIAGSWSLLPGILSAQVNYITGGQLQIVGAQHIDENMTMHWIMNTTTSTTGYASDSTGFFFNSDVTYPTGGGTVLWGPDGSVLNANLDGFAGTYGYHMDPNGNYLTLQGAVNSPCPAPPPGPAGFTSYSGGGLCDTAGRPFIIMYNSGFYNGAEQELLQVPNSQGGLSPYILSFVTISVKTEFQQPHAAECNTDCTVMVLQSILLPDGTSYTFKYDCDPSVSGQSQVCNSTPGWGSYYGEMTQMNLPTGGTINYSWQVFNDSYQQKGVWLQSREVVGGGWWNYQPYVTKFCTVGTQVGCTQAFTESGPDGLVTTSNFIMDNDGQPYPTSVSNQLTTTTTTWDFTHACTIALPGSGCAGHAYIVKLSETESILGPGGATLTKQTKYTYDNVPGQTYTVDGLITSVQEWGYYPGASPTFPSVPDRATYTQWYSPPNPPVQNPPAPYWGSGTNIHRPGTVTVCNNTGSSSACPGGGSMVSQTITTYDGTAPSGISGVLNHDDTRYSASQSVRGLPTSVQKWVSGSTYLTSNYTYDATGQLLTSTDPNHNQTSYSYADSYFKDNNAINLAQLAGVTAPGVTNAYPTSITLPPVNGVAFTQTFGYYYGSGKKAYSTDFNLQTTLFHFYNEPFDRLTSTIFPIGWNLINYVSQNEADVYVPVVDASPSVNCVNCRHEQIKYDGYGRKVSEQLVNDPHCPSEVDTSYDADGRVATKSHPFCKGTETPVFETYTYDLLSRVTQVTHPDGQSLLTAYGNAIIGGPSQQASTYGYGYPTLTTDEAKNQKQSWTDGLGRLIEVDEPSSTGSSSTSATGSVTITGYEQNVTVNPPCILYGCGGCIEYQGNGLGGPTTYFDQGWVMITVNGTSDTVNYGQGDTTTSVAQNLAAAINSDPNSWVNASVSGSTINLSARAAGDTTDYSLSASSATTDTSGNFYSASFSGTPSGPTLTGGASPGSIGSSPNGTFYTYDVSDNLLGVVQGVQTRAFAYDGLDRLTSATNPESGTITYTYDSDSNMLTKTDARGIVTTMTYDSHNRLTEKSYSDGTTPAVVFGYDITNVNGTTMQNPIGRLVIAEVLSSAPNWTVHAAYDSMGRVLSDWRRMPAQALLGISTPYTVNTTYNTGGEVIGDSNLFFSITPSYDTVGRLEQITSSLSDANHPATLLSINPVTGYTSAQALAQMTYGNGLIETVTYNNRLQPTQLRNYNPTTNADVLNLSYGYTNSAGANNGNVTSLNSTATQIFMRSYTYDSLNRLWTMSSPADASGCYGLAWTYDRYGNRTAQNATSGNCLQPQTPVSPNNNNRLQPPYQYDASGNMTADASHTYFYDAESRLIQVGGTLGNCSTATACYVYDAEGQRLEKLTGGSTTAYLRNAKGDVVAETDGGNTLLRAGYVYAGGGLIAEYENGTTYFVHADHLDDTRVMTTYSTTAAQNAQVYDSMDYLPYGEQIAGGTGTTHKFTGEERDAESGLDDFDARYMGSSLGRFMRPDPDNAGAIKGSPQSWNAYSYVVNNPLNAIDPDGLDCIYTSGATSDGVYVATETGNCSQSGGMYVDGTINQSSYTYDNGVLSYTYSNGDVGGDGIIDFNKGDSVTGADIAAAAIQGVQMAGAPFDAAEITWGAWRRWEGRHPEVGILAGIAGGVIAGGGEGMEEPPTGESPFGNTPEGRPLSKHYATETGPGRNIPGSVVDETINHPTQTQQLGDRTVYYSGDNDVTVVVSKTTGKIMSARKGKP